MGEDYVKCIRCQQSGNSDECRNNVFSFDPELITCLRPYYSNAGMGWVLQQKICKCTVVTPICCKTGWRLVLAGEKVCSPARLFIAVRCYGPQASCRILGNRALDTIDNPRLLLQLDIFLGGQMFFFLNFYPSFLGYARVILDVVKQCLNGFAFISCFTFIQATSF